MREFFLSDCSMRSEYNSGHLHHLYAYVSKFLPMVSYLRNNSLVSSQLKACRSFSFPSIAPPTIRRSLQPVCSFNSTQFYSCFSFPPDTTWADSHYFSPSLWTITSFLFSFLPTCLFKSVSSSPPSFA